MASSNINEKVQQALEEGHPWESIKAHLGTIDSPEAKSYLSGLQSASSAQADTQPKATASSIKTGLLDFIDQNPAEAALYGAGAYALLQAPKLASKVADYRLKQRELGLKERSLTAYESQVAKQGVAPESLNPANELIDSVRQNEFQKQSFLNDYAEQKYGVPLADLEKVSGGKLKTTTDVDVVGGAFSKGGGITVNPAGAFTQPSGYAQPNIQAVAPNVSPAPIPFELDEYSKSGMITGQQPKAPVAPTDPFAPRPNPYMNPSVDNPYMTPSVQEGVATGNTAQAVQTVVAKELDKATGVAPTLATFNRDANGNIQYPKGMSAAARQGAEAFAQQYPDHAKSLAAEGRFGILGAGSGDNNLFNSYGSDMMKRIRDEVNQGQMVGPYANYETKVNPAIKAISPETALGKELADLRASQTGGNFGPLGTPASIGGKKGGLIQGTNMVAKAVKAGGPAALLMSIADAANAAQQGKYGEAAVRGLDVATDTIPVIAQLKQGLSPTSAGEGSTLSPEKVQQLKNVNLLGSPYAQTVEAKKLREMEKYIRKVGAGRGIAPPSAYMR
jgi:hypothetical protein